MVEIDEVPATGDMAGFAFVAARTLVDIVLSMARDTCGGSAHKAAACMAGLAGDPLVLADEVEARHRMVEVANPVPRGGFVAALAAGAEAAVVPIVLAVAGDTRERSAAELVARFMATRALHRAMRAGESEVGKSMIERLTIKRDDRVGAPLVFVMASGACLRLRLRVATVEPDPTLDVARDLLVTALAPAVLPALEEGHMAGQAILLGFRVDFGDGTGGQQLTDHRDREICGEDGPQRNCYRGKDPPPRHGQ